MIFGTISLGASHWLAFAILASIAGTVSIATSYGRAGWPTWIRTTGALLKWVGLLLLAACLVEPLYTGTRPRPGSNLMVIAADNSKSLQLVDAGETQTRGEAMRDRLAEKTPWMVRLAQDFDVRKYAFDAGIRPVREFSELTLDGRASTIAASLRALEQRFRQKPVAGIILLTDGNATDGLNEIDLSSFPPIYPVALGTQSELLDLSITRVSVSQTNFEASPVTILAEIQGRQLGERKAMVRVLDEAGKEWERRTLPRVRDGESHIERFLIRPERAGISFYTVHTCLEGEESYSGPGQSAEVTLANNRRLATVDRGGGPYRVLYLTGRPNWEYKFLRRAMEEDDEVQLVGLIRVAKKEPKFTFRGRTGERTNPLFRGFGNQGDEQAEQYDEPVMIRLGTEDKDELRGGFPKEPQQLFQYHAIILDDIESAFLSQDQHSLVQEFVSRRGGGLLMLGGKESFAEGGYGRTPIGEMLPVYLDQSNAPALADGYRLKLTREGWLQPWIRTRANERDEAKRLEEMPGFKTVNRIGPIKPGASVLAEVETPDGSHRPALAVQPFGRGRVGAMLVADLWRWNLRRPTPDESDLEKSWRQTVRWLVADVPQRVHVETEPLPGGLTAGVRLRVKARDERYDPLDNATVAFKIHSPDGRDVELAAESSERAAGEYEAAFVPRVAGAYRATVTVTAPDGTLIGERQAGWAAEPETDEFRQLSVNRTALEALAAKTNGEVLELDELETFAHSLPNRKIPIVETWTYPLWHQWQLFVASMVCLVLEWGLRRWKGLP